MKKLKTIIDTLIGRLMGRRGSLRRVRLFLTDIDGTMTDGGMYYSELGDELKRFDAHDGMGLVLLREAGVKVGIVTSETRELNRRRAEKLHVDYLRQGVAGGKLETVREICREEAISLDEVAYIGDDVNCHELLAAVGVAACPADAVASIRRIPGIRRMRKRGGHGCVRELADQVLEARRRTSHR